MQLGLNGKIAWVTGASKGLGFASALGLAREGCNLAICSRDPAAIARAANQIRSETGREVLALAVDVTRPEDLQRFVDAAVERYGGVDILVSNTPGPPAGLFMDLPDSAWQGAFDTLLMPAVRLTRAAIPSMKARGYGRILYITSSGVKQPIPSLILSNALRAAVTGMMKTLSAQLAPHGITVNSVAPGIIATERLDYLINVLAERSGRPAAEVQAEQIADIPAGRYGTPEEFARAVVFLASEAASYITGSAIHVDGGKVSAL